MEARFRRRKSEESIIMSEVRLVIREAENDWSGAVPGRLADCAIAALSADPVTLAELEVACARFKKPIPNRSLFANLSLGLLDEPCDAGIVVIDHVARLVFVNSTYSSPEPTGDICYDSGHCDSELWLRYHLDEDWLFIGDGAEWRAVAEKRRRERAARPLIDVRSVFYGRPLVEFIAQETFAASGEDSIKQIHAAWLLTPREDLNGACPRDLAVERHDHVVWDLQHQCERWSSLRKCPPGVDQSSFAFRYAGFGTHELVLYYNLVRELLHSCRENLELLRAALPADGASQALMVENFLTNEIPRLERLRDEWLDTPDGECHGRTPRTIIDRERARLPIGMSGRDAVVDADCPCCQMLADMPGIMFWGLDGCNMDEEFAFDMRHRTREEYEAARREDEERYQRFNAQCEERKRLGVSDPGRGDGSDKSVWSSSFSAGDDANLPLGIRLFAIGGHLAELIVDIRGSVNIASTAPENQQLIDRLNRDFGNMRETLQSLEPSLAEALIDPVIDRFDESLAAVVSRRPDLSEKCQDLTDSLSKFLEPESEESDWTADDSESPF